MDGKGLKEKAAIILLSSITLISLHKLYQKFLGKKENYYDDTETENTSENDHTESCYSSGFESTSSKSSNIISEDALTDTYSEEKEYYWGGTRHFITSNGELVPKTRFIGSECSSEASFKGLSKSKKDESRKKQNVVNALQFVNELKKAKHEFIKSKTENKKLAVKDTKNQKSKNLYEDVGEISETVSNLSTDLRNLPTKPCEDDVEVTKSKTLHEKFMKEKAKQRKLRMIEGNQSSHQKIKKVSKPPKIEKSKTKANLSINAKDLNWKHNYIFFEVLATYADAFIDNPDGKGNELKRLIKRKQKKRY